MNRTRIVRTAVGLLLISHCMWSCGPTTQVPERKKLPGDEKKLVIPLPDPAADSATISLVNSYKPIAIPFLTQWAQQQQTGFIIDFRQDEGLQVQRAEYRVQRENAFTIPVVFLWDRHSAARAAHFMNMLETFTSVKANRISGSGGNTASGNCFHP